MDWVLWAIVLILQNGCFTWLSRSRNSTSIGHHACAAVATNSLWFASQAVVVSKVAEAIQSNNYAILVTTGVFYTAFTAIGSVAAHQVMLKREAR